MTSLTFVHAADLHLGAPFRGLNRSLEALSPQEKSVGTTVLEATYTALERLVSVCIAAQADFLVLAGDVYDSAKGSLASRFALNKAFLTLKEHNVRVFLAHGNHDPLEEQPFPWPDNVTAFSPEVTVHSVMRGGEALALVHGVSHTTAAEGRNLARQFRRKEPSLIFEDVFQLGVLHCAVQGQAGEHAAYAPCTVQDLQEAALDYWALGHVHTRWVLRGTGTAPYAVYPGSMQGLHVNEGGVHGCTVVRVRGKKVVSAHHVPIAPVVWQRVSIDTAALQPEEEEGAVTLLQLEAFATQCLTEAQQTMQAEAAILMEAAGLGFTPEVLVARLVLEGRTPLHKELAQKDVREDLQRQLSGQLSRLGIFVRDIRIATQPQLDFEALAARPDLVGETFRLMGEWQAEPAQLHGAWEQADEVLLKKLRKIRRYLPAVTPEEETAMVQEAHLLCLDLLEVE